MALSMEVYHAVRKQEDNSLKRAAGHHPPVRRFPEGLRTIHIFDPERNPVRFHPDSCGKGDKVARRPHLDELDA